jgi:cell division protease FtsH
MLNWWRKLTKDQRLEILIDVSIILIALVFLFMYYHQEQKTIELPLSQVIEQSKVGIFSKMEFEARNEQIVLTVADGVNIPIKDIEGNNVQLTDKTKSITKIGSLNLKELQDIGLMLPSTYSQTDNQNLTSFLTPFISLIILIPLMLFLFYYMGFFNKHNRFKKEKNDVSFASIGGLIEVKEGLKEVVGFLKDRTYFEKLGAQVPSGILLVGPPGTGKTLLARAIATEANVPFFFSSGAEFHTMWVAMAAKNVKALFKEARKCPNSIVFIDEFDALAHKRGFGATDLQRDESNTLNQLLSEMDGFKKDSKILILAATNRPEVLDPAVLRPGRFDRRINVSLPTQIERCEILKIHGQNKPFAKDARMDSIAKQTSGFSGADLAALLNEAAIIAGRNHKEKIAMADITKAIDKVLVGDERKGFILSAEEKRLIAYHEAGHAIVAFFTPASDKVQRISILPHGQAGGFTRLSVETEKMLYSKTKLLASITVLLGGRVAEELIFGDITSSAQNDIRQANVIIREMITHYGMGKSFGLRYCTFNETGIREFGDDTYSNIDTEIGVILKKCYASAQKVIIKHRKSLDKLALKLLEVESLNSEEITKLLSSKDI